MNLVYKHQNQQVNRITKSIRIKAIITFYRTSLNFDVLNKIACRKPKRKHTNPMQNILTAKRLLTLK